MHYLQQQCISVPLQKYDFKSKLRLSGARKVYSIDNGFVNSVGVMHSENIGKLFENLVFVELFKSGSKPNNNLFYLLPRYRHAVAFKMSYS